MKGMENQPPQQKESRAVTDTMSRLPLEMMSEILSRLPVKATMRFTVLNKTYRDMIKSREFARFHYYKTMSKAALLLLGGVTERPYRIIGFAPDPNAEAEEIDAPICRKIFDFSFPLEQPLYTAASDGLLFLCARGMTGPNNTHDYGRALWPRDLYICSPMTGQYMKIPVPASAPEVHIDTFGFGFSKGGKHKLARVFHLNTLSEARCHVYTLGGGWGDSLEAGDVQYDPVMKGATLNGRVYWLVKRGKVPLISCFDLDTEAFSTFNPPPLSAEFEGRLCLSVLDEEMCFTDNSDAKDIAIWLGKPEDGGEVHNWRKAYVIRGKNLALDENIIWPIHVFSNGNMFLAVEVENRLYFYCRSMGIMQGFHPLEMEAKGDDDDDDLSYWYEGTIATSNFKQSYVPLKAFAPAEEVHSFAPV